MHLEPEAVEPAAIVDEPDRTVGRVLLYPMPAVTASGVVGSPSGASAERGAALFEQLVSALVTLLAAARTEHDPELR
jgi:creatinine amidohydrolase/Fe(II)-dependent formamide hydrolase-like protein